MTSKMAESTFKHHLTVDPAKAISPIRIGIPHNLPSELPEAKETKLHPKKSGHENASVYFVGTATTIIEWEGVRLMTDPNFLHAGDHVHLGPGVTGTRRTNPSVDLHQLPRIDLVLLSHYHADHFDAKVEETLRRDLPIVTTPHAKEQLMEKKGPGERFEQVFDIDPFEDALVHVEGDREGKSPAIKISGMPGHHVPPGVLKTANDLLGAVPPTNGWMVELGYKSSKSAPDSQFESGYRIYISGDTLMVDELEEIPKRYAGKQVDLMLIHLGGTTIPSPSVPLLMVTMNDEQGIKLMQLIKPDVTIPIHYDDYDVFVSPLADFQKAVTAAGWDDRVVYLDRGGKYQFAVKQ